MSERVERAQKAMTESIHCLYLELPEAVANDVRAKYDEFLGALNEERASLLPLLDAAATEKTASEQRGEPGAGDWKWLPLKNILEALRKMKPNTWCWDFGLKYIDLRIDTRDMHALVKDREGNQIELERVERAATK